MRTNISRIAHKHRTIYLLLINALIKERNTEGMYINVRVHDIELYNERMILKLYFGGDETKYAIFLKDKLNVAKYLGKRLK